MSVGLNIHKHSVNKGGSVANDCRPHDTDSRANAQGAGTNSINAQDIAIP